MSAFVCTSCGQSWAENYCPTCHATIDRAALATAVSTPLGGAPRPLKAPLTFRPVHAAPAGAPETGSFTFTGTAGEYFRIWVVNVALTVLTVGIYAAWAKVRKRRYFWGSTQLGGRPFEYTGDPIAILKGNLILGVGAIVYYFASTAEPLIGFAWLAVFMAVYPWLFQKALRFNAYHTRHRNIRFGFDGSVGESYAINLGWPLLVPFSLGALWPWVHFRLKGYVLGNLRFGNSRFEFLGTPGPFYASFFKALGLAAAGGVAGFVVLVASFAAADKPSDSMPGFFIGMGLIYLAFFAAFGIYYSTRITNEVLNRTSVPGVLTLHSTLRAREVLALELGNLLATIGTLGLLAPWAAVRRARYRWEHIEARFSGPIDSVTASMSAAPGTLGDVAAENLDIDISL